MDRENIATIAPQIVMCSARMSRTIIKHCLVTLVCKCREGAWVVGGMTIQPTIIVHLEKNFKLNMCVN